MNYQDAYPNLQTVTCVTFVCQMFQTKLHPCEPAIPDWLISETKQVSLHITRPMGQICRILTTVHRSQALT